MIFIRKIISSLIAIAVSCISCMAFALFALPATESYSQVATGQTVATKYYSLQEIQTIADGIIKWKKSSIGLLAGASLLDDEKGLIGGAGESGNDWMALGTSRLHPEQDYPRYLEALSKKIVGYYIANEIKGVKYTDYQRCALTMLALKGDPRNVRYSFDGKETSADVISDFSFNMGVKTPLGDQGIASRIWALISIDSMQYPVPAGSKNTRETLITELLSQQCIDNGFALVGKYSDPDITAMVVQALAPYYNRTQTYKYKRVNDGVVASKSVRKVVDESLALLSSLQKNTGDFTAGWTRARNPQTTAQVALALTCLGIDPQKDSRFIKNGKSLVDGMLAFLQPDKGFKATIESTKSDSMASGQVLYTMAAIIRNIKNMRRLYDFRPEQSSALKANITKITAEIAAASDKTPRPKLLSISNSYKLIVDNEKMYVYNYAKIYDLLNVTIASSSTPLSNNLANPVYSGSKAGSGVESFSAGSSVSEISEAVIASSTNSGLTGSNGGLIQSGEDSISNSEDSGDRNLRIFIIVIIIVLIISGATLNFYMIRKARIKL